MVIGARRLVGLIALAVLLLLAAIVVRWAIASRDTDLSSDESTSRGHVTAPWIDSEGVHYGSEVYDPSGSIASVTATATQKSVLLEILHDDGQGIVVDPVPKPETNPIELATILEWPIGGEVKELTHRLLGTIIADTGGSLATWAEHTSLEGGVKFVAYDTANHQVVRTLNIADGSARPFAVDGEKIYVAGEEIPFQVWDIGGSTNRLAPVPNMRKGSMATDVHDGKLIVSGSEKTRLIDEDGDVIKTFDGQPWLTFSPDGSHVAGLTWDGGIHMDAFVWDVADAAEVPLKLPKNVETLDLQWEADGDLLIPTVAIDKGGDRLENASANYNSCSSATGECTQVQHAGRIEPSQVGSSSGSRQFGMVVGS